MIRRLQENALVAVQAYFAAHNPTVEWMDLPVGKRQVINVRGDKLAVHGKEYVSLYRKTNTLQHGMRADLLRHYADNGIFLVIYEEDTGTILVASAKSCLSAAPSYTMNGVIDGVMEHTCFIPRAAFHIVNKPEGSLPVDVR
jgi:hypothetical protein